jgi:hypothetical protein
MGEFSNKEHWQNCYGAVEEDFLEIEAIIPCWKAQTTQGLRCSLRADCPKRGRFSTQRALSAAQSATATHARSARRPRAVCAQTTREVSVWSARWPHVQTVKFRKKKMVPYIMCACSIPLIEFFFHYPASLYKGHVRIWTRDSCVEVQCLTNYTMKDTWI